MKNWTSIYRRGHELLIPTSINGKPAGLFVADTGSDGNMIDLSRAKGFTTTKYSIYEVMGLSGHTSLSETGGFTVDFAGLRLPVRSMDSMDLSSFGEGVTGFLGYPTLHQLVMHIDYRDNLVLFEAPNGKKQ
jgi:hypothetical protein